MLRKSGIILVVLIAVAIMVTASASAASANNIKTTKDNGWVLTSTSTIGNTEKNGLVATPTSKTDNTGNNGWVVTVVNPSDIAANTFTTSASDASVSTPSIMTASAGSVYYIIQGQAAWYSNYIPSCGGFFVDVNWGNSANSLQLTLYCPDGSTAGPYYDNADGIIDGRMNLYFAKQSGNVPAGTYYAKVYGYHVSGSQSYTFN